MNFKKLGLSVLLCLAVGYIGGMATADSITSWYSTLAKPWLNPPNWIFGPVWTLLYCLMGVSLYLVWNKKIKVKKLEKVRHIALTVFLIQLLLNFFWSFLFFNLHLLFISLVEIMLLWMAIFVTIILFKKFSKVAAYLLLPYLAWVSFATYLTWSIWILNETWR